MWNCIFCLVIVWFCALIAIKTDGVLGVICLVTCAFCFIIGFKANYDMFVERAEKDLPFELGDKVYKIKPLDLGDEENRH